MPTIDVELSDNPAGVDRSSIVIDYDGTLLSILSPGVSFSPPILTIDPGISVEDDSLNICISSDDLVESCGPNHMIDSCFYFILDINGPFAMPLMPLDGEITACPEQQIEILLTDNYGVSLPDLEFNIDGDIYTISSTELSYIGDSLLIFIPSSPLSEGVVSVNLSGIVDFNGNTAPDLSWSFTVDLTPPLISGHDPLDGESVPSSFSVFSVDIVDALSGIAELSFSINGNVYTEEDGCFSYDGSELNVNPGLCGFDIADGDLLNICIHAEDSPDYCIPNSTDSCFVVFVNDGGPVATIVEPLDGLVSSCPMQQIIVEISDPTGIDESSIELTVDGITYDMGDSELIFSDDLLIFSPPVAYADGDTINVVLSEVNDILGLGMGTTLSWSFIIDLSPPEILSITPPPGSAFTSDDTPVTIVLGDALTEINTTPLRFSVAGFAYTIGDISYSGDTASFSFSELGFTPASGESTRVCIRNLMDSPDYCPPNEIPERYCFRYYFDYTGPEANMYIPGDSSITSCVGCSLFFYIDDYTEVDPSTILLEIDGINYTTASPEVSYDGFSLFFDPDFFWEEGVYIPVTVISADDIYGNPLQYAPREFAFGIDSTPPVVVPVAPLDGETIYTYTPTITAYLSDNFSGVYPGMFSLKIDGARYTLAHPAMDITDSLLTFDLDAAGIILPSGTTEVCIDSVFDSAILCGPNMAERQCFSFIVAEDDGGPDAWMRHPREGTYSSCEHDSIILLIRDTDGINWPSLVVDINGYIHRYGSSGVTVLSDSTVLLEPAIPIEDGDTVFVTLEGITDAIDNLTSYDDPWFYIIDQSAPVASLISPLEGTVFNGSGLVSFTLYDSISGLDSASVYLDVNGDSIGLDDLIISGDTVTIDISLLSFDSIDTLDICVHGYDRAKYCDPNVMEPYCRTFYIDMLPPLVEFVSPEEYSYTSCSLQSIEILAVDTWGVDPMSLVLTVSESPVSDLDFFEDIFTYTPDSPYTSGDTIISVVSEISDTIGNTSTEDVTLHFIVDLDPPYLGAEFPDLASVTADIYQPMEIEISDSLSGVDPATVIIVLNGLEYSGSDAGFSDGLLSFDPEPLGISFSDGDTVEWCIYAEDLASEYCPANAMDTTCFFFTVNTSGPTASIVSPINRSYFACPPESSEIIVELSDEDGIDPASIRFRVNDSLAILGVDLFYDPPYLTYRPTGSWGSTGIVTCELTGVRDSLDNPLGIPLNWFFYLDMTPPYVHEFHPPEGEVLPEIPEWMYAIVRDAGSGLDRFSVEVSIDGTAYDPIVRGDTFMVHRDSLLSIPSDSMRFCVTYAEDTPDYCAANVMDSICNVFIVPTADFAARVISPTCGSFISCDSTDIRIIFTALMEIDESTIAFSIGDDTLSTTSLYLSLAGDTLIYSPPGEWSDGDTVRFSLLSAGDIEGHVLSSPVGCQFIVDMTPPVISALTPVPDRISGFTDAIDIIVRDSLSGLDPSSLMVVIDTDTFFIWDLEYSGGVLSIDTEDLLLAEYDTIVIDILASDNATLCGANTQVDNFTYYFDLNPPTVELVYPYDGAVTSCADSGFALMLDDINGIDDSIVVMIDGVEVISGYDGLSLIDSMLVYSPLIAASDTLVFSVVHVSDTLGNSASSPEFSVIYDTEPPTVVFHRPLDGSIVGSGEPVVRILLSDLVSGVLAESTIVSCPSGIGAPLTLAGFSLSGDTLVWDAFSAGFSFETGDTVEFCVLRALDTPDICPPNRMEEYCFSFIVNRDGPILTYLSPPESSFVACADIQTITLLSDPDGVLWDSLVFHVNGSEYGISDVSHDDSIFSYLSTFEHGDTVVFSVERAPDLLMHEMLLIDTLVYFIDLLPPEIAFVSPEPGITISDSIPVVCIGLFDNMSGVFEDSIYITVNGSRELYTDEPELHFDGFELCFYAESTGVSYHEGDTMTICLHAIDSPDTCAASAIDTCFWINFGDTGPYATQIYPEHGIYTSCPGGYSAIFFEDEDGLLYDSLGVIVHGETLLVVDSHPELDLRGDTLFFTGTTAIPPGDSIPLLPFGRDSLLNDMSNDLVVYLLSDTSGPELLSWLPSEEAYHDTSILIEMVDDLSGTDSVWFEIDGIEYAHTFNSADTYGLSPFGNAEDWYPGADDSLLFFHERDTVDVSVFGIDGARYCGANHGTGEFSFYVLDDDTIGPQIIPVSMPFRVIAGRTIEIRAIVTDTSSVDSAFIHFDISGRITEFSPVLPMSISADTASVEIGPFTVTDSIVFVLWAYDGDNDFGRNEDISSSYTDTMQIEVLGSTPPEITPIDADGIISCIDGYVRVLVEDEEGINPSSLVVSLGSNIYSGSSLTFLGDTVLLPLPDMVHGDTLVVTVLEAEDILGNSIEEEVSWSFVFDFMPPYVYILTPDSSVITDEDVISIVLGDDISALNIDSLNVYINDMLEPQPYDITDSILTLLIPEIIGSLYVELTGIMDTAGYCGNNIFGDTTFAFLIPGDFICETDPSVFTPNGDDYNPVVRFTYPKMDVAQSTIRIFDIDGRAVRKMDIHTSFPESGEAFWDGNNQENAPVRPGIYIYTIETNGKVICKGTVVLAR